MGMRGRDRLWLWFGLSRSSFLTLPRVLMHEMPDEWQEQMACLLEQFDEEFPNTPAGATVVKPRKGAWPSLLLNYRHPEHAEIAQAPGVLARHEATCRRHPVDRSQRRRAPRPV